MPRLPAVKIIVDGMEAIIRDPNATTNDKMLAAQMIFRCTEMGARSRKKGKKEKFRGGPPASGLADLAEKVDLS